ncbi:MAG TPA: hypothetical protein VH417_19715 [Vicinamibacterales bacterium]|jgi:hypothetical protein
MRRYRWQLSSIVAGAALAIATAEPALAQWAPPLGIPSPSFGIKESAPASPSPWVIGTPGFYYVDANSPAASDTANPFGTPAHPRSTIPSPVPAGSVVELHGVYDAAFTSPNILVVQGRPDRPVFVRGVDSSSRPQIHAGWQVTGSYAIFENLDFGPADDSTTGFLVFLAPSDHLALRSSEVHGNRSGGGLGIESWEDGASISDVVISRNIVHDNGDVHADYDQDVHGIHVGVRASSIWILDNEMANNSGDGIQINAGSAADQSTTHHVYVGRNVAHHNKQTGFWVKQATDVIFSENECFEHRPSNSSLGQCMGAQYATERVWFLFNQIHDSDFGIGVSSDSDLGSGTESYFIGNIIYRIHHSADADYNPDTGWSNAAIMLAGGVRRYIVNNTIDDVDAGINSPSSAGSLEIADNIIGRVAAPGNHLFIEIGSLASSTTAHHNLFSEQPRFRLGDAVSTPDAGQLANMASIAADPRFADPDAGNFTIPNGSPAVNAGELNPVYDAFQRRYGISIAVDILGRRRAGSARTDIGAYLGGGEHRPPASPAPTVPPPDAGPSPAPAVAGLPGAPSRLEALVLGRIVRLTWDAPVDGPEPTQYQIEAGTAPGRADTVLQTSNAATVYIGFARSSASVYVRIRAVNGAGAGPPSNEIFLTVR